MGGAGASLLSENENENAYERQRLEHIQRNREYLRRLGVVTPSSEGGGLGQALCKEEKNEKKRRKKGKDHLAAKREPSRRSSRVMGKAVEYTSDALDTLLGVEDYVDDDEGSFGVRGPTSTSMGGKKKRGKENRREEVLDLYKQWLQESRQALLDVKVSSSDDSNDEWRREAERRWGPKVTMVAGEDHGGGNSTCCWKNFVHSRLSNPPPPSPDSLLQEFYAHDTWSLLVCCILMSRVSSWETKHGCISSFFKEYPTPSSLSDSDPAVVREIMHPLGLFENRMKALLSLNHKFLTMPDFKVDLTKENKIYGIGQFGVDSFNIFCKSNTKCKPSDKTLASYCNWHKRQSTEHRD